MSSILLSDLFIFYLTREIHEAEEKNMHLIGLVSMNKFL